MKRIIFLLLSIAALSGCGRRLFADLPPTGNDATVYPMRLNPGVNHIFLTDYFPQSPVADSVTTSGALELTPTKSDWSEFDVKLSTTPFVGSVEVWRDGRRLSIVALAGERREGVYMLSEGAMMKVVSVRTSRKPSSVVVVWQNCRLPQTSIVDIDDAFGVVIPKDARDVERSFLRVYAATDSTLFNDMLIPLEYGKPVTSASQLTRHDTQAQVLYSLMIDRFSNGNKSNDWRINSPEVLPQVDYQGGDLKGITEKIKSGFFDDLGVTTIWISPITQNPYDAWGLNADPKTKFSGYHGYWPIYTTVIDPRFGTDAELRELLKTAHDHNLNVILDYVANHLHINSPVLKAHPDWTTPMYLPDGRRNLELWDEQRLTTWFDVHIPTLDLEREEICEPMTDSALYWIANYDFDGFRHDACKHIPENYWRMLSHKMKTRFADRQLWQIGETYGSPQLIGSYVKSGMIDAQFDFNVYHTAIEVIERDEPMSRIVSVVAESAATYGAHSTMGNITGNHDKPRFISIAGGALSSSEDTKAAGWHRTVGVGDPVGYYKLGLLEALIFTIPGVPCVYQGDEYGVPGANDPDNRRMMSFEGYSPREQMHRDMVRRLVTLRRNTLPLIYGDMVTLFDEGNVWAFMRGYMGEYTGVVMNNGDKERTVEFLLPEGFGQTQQFTSNFGSSFTASRGRMSVTVKPYNFEILTKL